MLRAQGDQLRRIDGQGSCLQVLDNRVIVHRPWPQIRILHVGFRRDMSKFTRYFLLPSSHVAHGVAHPGSPAPPDRSNVRNNTTSPAAHPPNIAVNVKYILSLAAAVIARSAPPGIDVILLRNENMLLLKYNHSRLHGNAADSMEYISSLSRFHTHSYWNLQAQTSAIYIWLHLVSLKERHEADPETQCSAKPLPAELNPGLTWWQQRALVYDLGYIVAKKILAVQRAKEKKSHTDPQITDVRE